MRTRQPDWWPRPPELDATPEMAVLAVVRATIEILTAAMLAANPHLAADTPPPSDAELRAARRVLTHAEHLRSAIDHYRAAVTIVARAAADADLDGDDIPF
jgi:hypothetical protein